MSGPGSVAPESFTSDQMIGSARAFLPDHPQADDLYAVAFARDPARVLDEFLLVRRLHQRQGPEMLVRVVLHRRARRDVAARRIGAERKARIGARPLQRPPRKPERVIRIEPGCPEPHYEKRQQDHRSDQRRGAARIGLQRSHQDPDTMRGSSRA